MSGECQKDALADFTPPVLPKLQIYQGHKLKNRNEDGKKKRAFYPVNLPEMRAWNGQRRRK